jgi:hypothetical protein
VVLQLGDWTWDQYILSIKENTSKITSNLRNTFVFCQSRADDAGVLSPRGGGVFGNLVISDYISLFQEFGTGQIANGRILVTGNRTVRKLVGEVCGYVVG